MYGGGKEKTLHLQACSYLRQRCAYPLSLQSAPRAEYNYGPHWFGLKFRVIGNKHLGLYTCIHKVVVVASSAATARRWNLAAMAAGDSSADAGSPKERAATTANGERNIVCSVNAESSKRRVSSSLYVCICIVYLYTDMCKRVCCVYIIVYVLANTHTYILYVCYRCPLYRQQISSRVLRLKFLV